MTPRAAAIVEVIRSALAALDGLDPAEQDLIVAAIVADLRARRPVVIRTPAMGVLRGGFSGPSATARR